MPPKRNGISAAAIEQLITQRVAGALLASEANQNSGNGNKNNNGSHDSGSGGRRATEGAVGGALTWWNSHVRTVGHDAAYGMPWKNLIKMITEAYCPRSEIKKLDTELWNLTMKAHYPIYVAKRSVMTSQKPKNASRKQLSGKGKVLMDLEGSLPMTVGHDAAYGMPWKNLIKMITEAYCPRSEIKKLDTELWNLTMKEAIKLARSLMDQKVRAYAARVINDKLGAKGSSNARNNGSRSFLIVHEASRQLGEDDEFPAERLHLEPGG
ncbi:hypothetical protein Tco_1428786 [Tanacetum coccineum]